MLHFKKKKESMDNCENLVIHSEFLKYNMYINEPYTCIDTLYCHMVV